MFGLIVLLTHFMSWSNEPCMARPTLIDLNSIELNHHLFTISLDKCNECCEPINDLSAKICVPSKTKDVNVKVFKMITKKIEAKILVKLISCNCKYKFSSCKLQSKME